VTRCNAARHHPQAAGGDRQRRQAVIGLYRRAAVEEKGAAQPKRAAAHQPAPLEQLCVLERGAEKPDQRGQLSNLIHQSAAALGSLCVSFWRQKQQLAQEEAAPVLFVYFLQSLSS